MTEDKPAPGLDDDGSGVMVLLEILRVVVETGFKPQKNVQIMAFASEEVGLLGSDQIAKYYKSEGRDYGLEMCFLRGEVAGKLGLLKFTFLETETSF